MHVYFSVAQYHRGIIIPYENDHGGINIYHREGRATCGRLLKFSTNALTRHSQEVTIHFPYAWDKMPSPTYQLSSIFIEESEVYETLASLDAQSHQAMIL